MMHEKAVNAPDFLMTSMPKLCQNMNGANKREKGAWCACRKRNSQYLEDEFLRSLRSVKCSRNAGTKTSRTRRFNSRRGPQKRTVDGTIQIPL
jgi:hypothetical protein